MKHIAPTVAVSLVLALLAGGSVRAQGSPAADMFERLKGLEGEWIDVDGILGPKGKVAVTYRVTGGGTTVVETFPVGTAEEMVTVYYRDEGDLVLTHYCSAGNQPRMRAKPVSGSTLAFDFDGGTNIDPAVTSHMHAVTLEFLAPDELRASWHNWSKGKPDEHLAVFRIVRKK